jgi:3-oxoacyl-[acyl-carrier protein] reductase
MLQISDIAFDFSGKTVVITGAAGSFGRWFTDALHRAGARLVLLDQRAIELPHGLPDAQAHRVDLTRESDIVAIVDDLRERDIPVHGLVNAVGMFPPARLLDVSVEFWDRMFAANVTAPLLCSRVFARWMIERNTQGSIVTLTSNSARVWKAGNIPYCASKAAAHTLSVGFALELAEFGIRVNSVEPGYAPLPGTSPELIERVRQAMPLKAIGGPMDTAALVMYLLSDASRLVTGAFLNIDGGWPLTPAAVDPNFAGISGMRPGWN